MNVFKSKTRSYSMNEVDINVQKFQKCTGLKYLCQDNSIHSDINQVILRLLYYFKTYLHPSPQILRNYGTTKEGNIFCVFSYVSFNLYLNVSLFS